MKIEDLKGLYIAHRGVHGHNIIENTIPAFSLALEKSVPIELDLQILKDGNIVVYHDDDLKRLMGINRKICSYTSSELRQLVFPNTNYHIPSFEEILSLVNGKVCLVIEVKHSSVISYKKYCKKIVSILNNYSGNFIIKSFDIRIVNWFLRNTDYISGLLIIKRKNNFYDWLMRKKIIVSSLDPDFISVQHTLVTSKMVQDFRRKKPVFVWTIDSLKKLDTIKSYADSYLIEKCYF